MSRRSLDNQKSLCTVAVIPFAASPIPIFQCAEIEAATYKSPLPPKKMAKLQTDAERLFKSFLARNELVASPSG
jgi:hypothetical protein